MEKLYLIYGMDSEFDGMYGMSDYRIAKGGFSSLDGMMDEAREMSRDIIEGYWDSYSASRDIEVDDDDAVADAKAELMEYDVLEFNDFMTYEMAVKLGRNYGLDELINFCGTNNTIDYYNELMNIK